MSPTSYLAALPRVKSTTREVYQSLRAVSMPKAPKAPLFAAVGYALAWSPGGARLLAAPRDDTIVRMDAPPLTAP